MLVVPSWQALWPGGPHHLSLLSELIFPRLLSAGRCQIRARSPLTSQPIPDQTLTVSLCAPLVSVPRAHFSRPQIKLSAAFLTCETTKKACLSPYWGHVFELESGPATGLACWGYGLLLTTTCMSYPVSSVMHF